MDNDKYVARETLRRLYLFSRRVIKFCKLLNSEQIIRHLIIYTIGDKPYTIKELAMLFDVSHPWMSTTVGRLEKKGVVLKKSNEDSRCRVVALTSKGARLREEVSTKMDQHCKCAFKNLAPKEVKNFGEYAKKVNFEYDEPILEDKTLM